MTQETPSSVIAFWFDDVGKEGWFGGGDALDETIRARFATTWEVARAEKLEHWRTDGLGSLAYVLVTDQFSRNMFREDPKGFSTDGLARRAAKFAISQGFDRPMTDLQKHFLYLPFMHSEIISDQDRGVRLILERMDDSEKALLHARAHRTVIRRYGRFPHRNAVLSRPSTQAEQGYLEQGGYGAVVRELEAAA